MTLDELLETDQGESINAVETAITPQATLTDIVRMIEAKIEELKVGYLDAFGTELAGEHGERVDSIRLTSGKLSTDSQLLLMAAGMLAIG